MKPKKFRFNEFWAHGICETGAVFLPLCDQVKYMYVKS